MHNVQSAWINTVQGQTPIQNQPSRSELNSNIDIFYEQVIEFNYLKYMLKRLLVVSVSSKVMRLFKPWRVRANEIPKSLKQLPMCLWIFDTKLISRIIYLLQSVAIVLT